MPLSEHHAQQIQILELVGCCDRNADKAQAQAHKYGLQAMSLEEFLAGMIPLRSWST